VRAQAGRKADLVVQVSGGALARTSSVAPSIKIKSKFSGKNRVDTIFRAGLSALLFFLLRQACFFVAGLARCSVFSSWSLRNPPPIQFTPQPRWRHQPSWSSTVLNWPPLVARIWHRWSIAACFANTRKPNRCSGGRQEAWATASCHPSRRARARASSD